MLEIAQIPMPPPLSEEELEGKSKGDLAQYLQSYFDQLSPGFMKITNLMLQYKSLFTAEIRAEISNRYNAAIKARGGEAIVIRGDFIGWAPNVIGQQIRDIRNNWVK